MALTIEDALPGLTLAKSIGFILWPLTAPLSLSEESLSEPLLLLEADWTTSPIAILPSLTACSKAF